MKLRVKVSPRSGERDQMFSHIYDEVRYTIGSEPVEVSEVAGQYLARSFSDIIEVVPEPNPEVAVLVHDEEKPAVKQPRAKKAQKKKK